MFSVVLSVLVILLALCESVKIISNKSALCERDAMKDSPVVSVLVKNYQHGKWNAGVIAHKIFDSVKSNVASFFRYLSIIDRIEQYLEPFIGSSCNNSAEVSTFTRSYRHFHIIICYLLHQEFTDSLASLEKSVQSLGEVVNVLEYFRNEQKDAIESHELQLQNIVGSMEEMNIMTNRFVTRLSQLKIEKSAGKRMSYGLLSPFEYYVTAMEEIVNVVLTMAARNKANQQLSHYTENIGAYPFSHTQSFVYYLLTYSILHYIVKKCILQVDQINAVGSADSDKTGKIAVLESSSDPEGHVNRTLDIYGAEIDNYLSMFEQFKTHFPDEITKNKELLVSLASSMRQQLHHYTSDFTPHDMHLEKSGIISSEPNDIKFVHFTSFIVSNIFTPSLQKFDDVIQTNPNACFIFISPYWYRSYEAATPLISVDAKQKSKLIIDSIKKVMNINSYEDCYLWVDTLCLQSSDSTATKLATVYHAISKCDIVITPVEAAEAPAWTTDIMSYNYFQCDHWNGNTAMN